MTVEEKDLEELRAEYEREVRNTQRRNEMIKELESKGIKTLAYIVSCSSKKLYMAESGDYIKFGDNIHASVGSVRDTRLDNHDVSKICGHFPALPCVYIGYNGRGYSKKRQSRAEKAYHRLVPERMFTKEFAEDQDAVIEDSNVLPLSCNVSKFGMKFRWFSEINGNPVEVRVEALKFPFLRLHYRVLGCEHNNEAVDCRVVEQSLGITNREEPHKYSPWRMPWIMDKERKLVVRVSTKKIERGSVRYPNDFDVYFFYADKDVKSRVKELNLYDLIQMTYSGIKDEDL